MARLKVKRTKSQRRSGKRVKGKPRGTKSAARETKGAISETVGADPGGSDQKNRSTWTENSELAPEHPAPRPSAAVISAEGLCALTGFTDRWHRIVAAKGYYPPPVDGVYQMEATIRGLFKYQRELTAKSKEELQRKHELLLDKRIEQAEFDLSVAKQKYKPTAEIAVALMAIQEEQKSALNFFLIDQLPALNAGLDAAAQRKNNRECLVSICKRFQEWARQYEPPAAEKDLPAMNAGEKPEIKK